MLHGTIFQLQGLVPNQNYFRLFTQTIKEPMFCPVWQTGIKALGTAYNSSKVRLPCFVQHITLSLDPPSAVGRGCNDGLAGNVLR